MRIANPIYDVVFKYLLDDEKVARLMLSALLGQEVLELQFRPTELRYVRKDPAKAECLVLRMDFAATLRLEGGGHKLVLIEIQKANNASDIGRFRRYLGTNYCNEDNAYLDEDGLRQPLPLVTIYFLGQGLEGIDLPVLKINRHYVDAATGDVVAITDPFVEALTHDSIVVQINRLKNHRRTDLERLLTVFDQDRKARLDHHILDILVDNFPERYREVLRRLEKANADQDVHDTMELEDDYWKELQSHARALADLDKVIESRDKVIEDKDKVIEDKDKVIEDKDKAIEESGMTIHEKDRTIETMARTIADLQRRLGQA